MATKVAPPKPAKKEPAPRPKMLETSSIWNKRIELTKKLGEGCFGEVFRGIDTTTGKGVAIKFEVRAESDTLKAEAELLELLQRPFQRQGFAEFIHFAREGPYSCVVMELLGISLEDTLEEQGGTYDIRSAALIAKQCILRLEYLHSKCLVHRDIKPENFMWGVGDKIHHIYIIDFGLSIKYWSKTHVSRRGGQSMTGTARYASINAHSGYTQSRRDDMEAVGHMFFYFLRGKLPWSGLKAKTDKEKYRKIMEMKQKTPISSLCEGFPIQFLTYLDSSRKLEFKARPDYQHLVTLFDEILAQDSEGLVDQATYPWLEKAGIDVNNLIPVEPRDEAVKQPDEMLTTQETRKSRFFSIFYPAGASPLVPPVAAASRQSRLSIFTLQSKASILDTE